MTTNTKRWLELIVLFVALPICVALFVDPTKMWTILLTAGAVSLALLHITPEFQWRSLLQGGVNWRMVFLLGVITLTASTLLCWWLMPDRLFLLVRERPLFLPLLAIAYPIILVLPQELIFRPLFFKRYADLFPSETVAIWVNAAVFSLAHLMYWHWVVLAMTFIGSFIFARGYLRGSFKQALADHSIAGLMIFISGLGWLFYSGGNVAQ